MTPSVPSGPKRRPGRPPKPSDGGASVLCQLGGLMRQLRVGRGLTLMAVGEMTGYSWQHIGAVERGQVAPSEDLVAACERALAAGGRLASIFPAVVREQASLRHRREAVRRDGIERDSPAPDWARLAAAAQRPSSVSAALADELEQVTDRQRALYHELSSAEMLVPVEAHLSLLASLMRGNQAAPVRHRIASAAVEAAGFAAWLWFDLGDQFKMKALYQMAGSLLGEAANPGLGSYVMGYQALAAGASGMSRLAFEYAGAARDQAPSTISSLALSWLSAVGAEAAAESGDRRGTLVLLGRARGCLEAADGREPWMYDFDASALAVCRGRCHLLLGQPREAMAAFTEGLSGLPQGCGRRAAFLAIGLAEACLAGHEVDGALEHARRALAAFATGGSRAGLMRVRGFRDQLALAGCAREAEDLDERARHYAARLT